MKATYTINGVELDDLDGRWLLEAATKSPTPSGVEVGLVSSPGVHGARLTGQRVRKPGTLALSVLIQGDSHAELRERWQEFLLVLSSWQTDGLLNIEYFDGEVTSRNHGVISNDLAPKECGPCALVVPVTIALPGPFWEDVTRETLLPVLRENVNWGGLAGGSAPVFPTVHVRGSAPVTGVRVECLTSGKVASWSGSVSELFWTGWNVARASGGEADRGLGFGVEAEPVLYPNSEGEYRLRVEVSGGGESPLVELIGSRRFQ